MRAAAFAVLALLGMAFAWSCTLDGPPSDAAMIHNLDANRGAFDALLAMIREDRGLERVDDDWTRPDDPMAVGVSFKRIAAYRLLFQKAGIPRGFYSFEPYPRVLFVAYASGSYIRGAAKSYYYASDPPTEGLVDGPLDAYHDGRKVNVARHIGGNWYLLWRRD